jgi:ABC transporter DrrB family efflux protein
MENAEIPKVQDRPWLYWAISDSFEIAKRSLIQVVQVPDQLLGVTLQPIIFIVLFRYVFGGAISTGSVSYVNYLIPGIFIMTAVFTSLTTMVGLAADMNNGIVDRFRSLPMVKSAILIGTGSADLVRSSLGIVVMIIAGLAVGFRPHADVGAWIVAILLLLLVTYTFSWLSAPLGMLAKSVQAAQQFGFFFFPLTFISGAFVPVQSMPSWLRGFAINQPLSQFIAAIRSLLLNEPVGNHIWVSLLWCVGIIGFSVPVASWLFRRKTGG